MVVKKLAAAAITALTVASAVCVTSYAAAAERASVESAATYYYTTITVAVGKSGVTDWAKKDVNGNADGGITSGLPSGEAVWLVVLNKDGYMASDSIYFNSYSMEHFKTLAIPYSPGKGVVGSEYKLRASYQRQYSYNPEQFPANVKWRP